MKLESYFIDANSEYEKMAEDLKQGLKPGVFEEVEAFVQKKTDDAMKMVWERLRLRYDRLEQLEDSLPDEIKKEDRDHYIREFFRLADPGEVSLDLQEAFRFETMESEYSSFVDKMAYQEYGEVFKRYNYPASFFNGLRSAILHHIEQLVIPLKEYTEAIGRHALLLGSIQKGQRNKAFIKGGASLLGMMIGIPFAGAGVGALMGNDEGRANESLSRVFDNWNEYLDRFAIFLEAMEDQYRLAMMTLYGGTVLRVNAQFGAMHFTFGRMVLVSGEYEYILALTDAERKDTEKWIRRTAEGIIRLIESKDWKGAIGVSSQLAQKMRQRPVTARSEMYEGKSAIYLSYLYYYTAYQEALLEEYRNGHHDSFYSAARRLYKELPLMVQDKDAALYSQPSELLFRYVKEALKRNQPEDLAAVLNYMKRIEARMDKDGPFIGEMPDSVSVFSREWKGYLLIGQFLRHLSLTKDRPEEDGQDIQLSMASIKALREIDRSIGMKDELTNYLTKVRWKAAIQPVYAACERQKKKLAAAGCAILLLAGSLQYGEDLYTWCKEKTADISWFKQADVPALEKEDIYYRTTADEANIRSKPSLESRVLTTVTPSVSLHYLNKKKTDKTGRKWMKIQLPDGQKGWISKDLAKKQAPLN